jgi:beta-galactosidase
MLSMGTGRRLIGRRISTLLLHRLPPAALSVMLGLGCGNSTDGGASSATSNALPPGAGNSPNANAGGASGATGEASAVPPSQEGIMTLLPRADGTGPSPGGPADGSPPGPANGPSAVPNVRTIQPFDDSWLFFKGDAVGADQPAFTDTAWTSLSVPHDWAIEGPFVANNPSGAGGGFAPAGVGWYRKHFVLPATTAPSARVFIEFDGVMAHSDVFINGFRLGNRPNGYVSFRYELTGHLNSSADNVLSVKADNSAQPASRWYAGAGIYRHVRLIVTDPVHIEPWATVVTTPVISAAEATAHVATRVVNQGTAPQSVLIEATLVDPSGMPVSSFKSAAQTLAAGASASFDVDVAVANPRLWGIDAPNLYQVRTNVQVGGVTVDDDVTTFGIRTAVFDPDRGFLLNGQVVKIKGAALHHDASALGAAVPLRAWQRRAALLKSLGANAIRTSHNPVAPEVLDLFDRMGLLVMSEFFDAWRGHKPNVTADYASDFDAFSAIDATDTLKRDRNHPSIVIYSLGNEIRDPIASMVQTARTLTGVYHEVDPTRPVTQALFRPARGVEYPGAMLDVLDVFGANYRPAELLAANTVVTPHHAIVETESTKTAADWTVVRDNAAFSGYFVWAGFDYLGESITPFPDIAKIRGLFDRAGTPYDVGWQHGSWWSSKPFVHVSLVGAGATVYSNCPSVDLLVNGTSQGAKRWDGIGARVWPGVSGTLRAVCTDQANVFDETRTASGPPARVVISVDHTRLMTDWNDVSYVKATVSDANGAPIIGATNPVTFSVTGPGTIVGVDSGSLSSVDAQGRPESFRGLTRRAFGGDEGFAPTRSGDCFAIVRADAAGQITISASAPGLATSAVTVDGTAGPFVPCSDTCD